MNSFQTIDYHAFMMRLWRTDETGPWRVSLEDPHTRQTHHFPSLKRAMAFVEKQIHGDGQDLPGKKVEGN